MQKAWTAHQDYLPWVLMHYGRSGSFHKPAEESPPRANATAIVTRVEAACCCMRVYDGLSVSLWILSMLHFISSGWAVLANRIGSIARNTDDYHVFLWRMYFGIPHWCKLVCSVIHFLPSVFHVIVTDISHDVYDINKFVTVFPNPTFLVIAKIA